MIAVFLSFWEKAQIKAYVDECQVAYKARLLRRRAWQREEIAKAYLKRAADEEDADMYDIIMSCFSNNNTSVI